MTWKHLLRDLWWTITLLVSTIISAVMFIGWAFLDRPDSWGIWGAYAGINALVAINALQDTYGGDPR